MILENVVWSLIQGVRLPVALKAIENSHRKIVKFTDSYVIVPENNPLPKTDNKFTRQQLIRLCSGNYLFIPEEQEQFI